MLEYTGEFTVYFNRRSSEFPRVWSISLPTANWELEVCEVRVSGVQLTTVYRRTQPDTLAPVAWFAGYGHILIDDAGLATITPIVGVAQVA